MKFKNAVVSLLIIFALIFFSPVISDLLKKSDIFSDLIKNDTVSAFSSKKEQNTIKIDIDEDEYDITDKKISIEIENYIVTAGKDEEKVLIYHTHITEGYTPEGESAADKADQRSDDKSQSVYAVGEELKRGLESGGFDVVHDGTNHEAKVYSHSYDLSLDTMIRYREENGITTFIDVHRDSIDDADYASNDVVVYNGKTYTRIMFVVGTGEGMTNGEFSEIPDWESNYALAQRICDRLNELVPGIAKNIMVKKGRYNQHVSDKCMLVEMGYGANHLSEAINSADALSKAITDVFK